MSRFITRFADVEHDEYTAEADGYTDDDYADVSDDNGSDDEE